MERRVAFNPGQFLKKPIPLSAYKFDMLEGFAQDFSGGFFAENASPFFLLPTDVKKYTQASYLSRLEKFIRGVSDAMALYLIENDDGVRSFFIKDADDVYFDRLERAKESLRPTIFLDYLNIDYGLMNTILIEKFGFDFANAAERVGQLSTTLHHEMENTPLGEIKAAPRVIIMKGPEILANVQSMHPAIQKFMNMAELESAAHYPQIAEKINAVMDLVIDDLQTRIAKALPGRATTHAIH